MRGSIFLLAPTKTNDLISVDLRENVQFLSLPLFSPPLSRSVSISPFLFLLFSLLFCFSLIHRMSFFLVCSYPPSLFHFSFSPQFSFSLIFLFFSSILILIKRIGQVGKLPPHFPISTHVILMFFLPYFFFIFLSLLLHHLTHGSM